MSLVVAEGRSEISKGGSRTTVIKITRTIIILKPAFLGPQYAQYGNAASLVSPGGQGA